MHYKRLFFSGHAVRRMFERGIKKENLVRLLENGTVIEEYPDDEPFPSYLIFGLVKGRALHAVAALDSETKTCYIVTVYEPNPELWKNGFKKRRPQ